MLFLALLAPLLLLGNQVQAGGIGNLVKEIINQKFDSESQKSMSSDPKEQEEFKVTKEYIQAYFGEISPEIIDRYEVKLEAKKSKLQSKGRQLTPKEIKKSVKKAVKEIEKKIRKQVRKQKKVLENTGVAQIGNARIQYGKRSERELEKRKLSFPTSKKGKAAAMLIVLLSSIGLSTLMGIMVRKAQGRKLEEDS